ncbi:hypothetical protein [Stutzerimonas chloritidismutans]|jgi:hypothetical protein|uniref:Uncharacterized protein n=1 Tax=Stutzerimonas chloritidismutans TaxID=203192 RepID=A0ABU9M735_STUCH
MKNAIQKFRAVPSFVKTLGVGAASMVAAASAHAGAVAEAAAPHIATAQADGESTGGLVVGVVAALAVVGVIISLVRKV